MQKRILIGGLMALAGLGLLTPPAWALFSPFLINAFGYSSQAIMTRLAASVGGMTLLYTGVRRMLVPLRAG